jgi:NAD(P)H dehydrogenase (quinone)
MKNTTAHVLSGRQTVLIVLAHPEKNSLNHAIAAACRDQLVENGHTAILRDLYAENFDPILRTPEIPKGALVDAAVQSHCDDLAKSDGLIVAHPNWWSQPPAILTGWIDRVIRPGFAYEFVAGPDGKGVPRGLLKLKTALVFNTANTPPDQELALYGDPLESIWKKSVCGLCGIPHCERQIFSVVIVSTPEERRQWLAQAREMTSRNFPKAN